MMRPNLLPRIIIMGPEGSGKTTHGMTLAEYLRIPYLSTGNMLRAEMHRDTIIGREIKTTLAGGNYATDQQIDAALYTCLGQDECLPGWILDGYPRRLSQALTLDHRYAPSLVIALEMSDEAVKERLFDKQGNSYRRVCPLGHVFHRKNFWPRNDLCIHDEWPLQPRADDTPANINQRLKSFRDQTEPVIAAYAEQGIVVTFDAEDPPSTILKALLVNRTILRWLRVHRLGPSAVPKK